MLCHCFHKELYQQQRLDLPYNGKVRSKASVHTNKYLYIVTEGVRTLQNYDFVGM